MEKKKIMSRQAVTIFATDPQNEPAFEKNTVVSLTEDYTESSGYRPCNKYLTKDAVCLINKCALFKYEFDDKTQGFTKKASEIEWCHVTIGTPIADPENEEGYVKAEHLCED